MEYEKTYNTDWMTHVAYYVLSEAFGPAHELLCVSAAYRYCPYLLHEPPQQRSNINNNNNGARDNIWIGHIRML